MFKVFHRVWSPVQSHIHRSCEYQTMEMSIWWMYSPKWIWCLEVVEHTYKWISFNTIPMWDMPEDIRSWFFFEATFSNSYRWATIWMWWLRKKIQWERQFEETHSCRAWMWTAMVLSQMWSRVYDSRQIWYSQLRFNLMQSFNLLCK